jgi:DNA-binding Lrp family transcriptional regulator
MEVDSVDIRIIGMLAKDCRIPFDRLGIKVGLSGPALRKRIRALFVKGVIARYTLNFNPFLVGGSPVIVLMRVKQSTRMDSILKSISERSRITSASLLANDHYMIKTTCSSSNEIYMLEREIRAAPNIISYSLYPLQQFLKNSVRITKLQSEALKHLIKNPRMKYKELAGLINGTPKGVKKAIQRLVDNDALRFSIECRLPMYLVMAKMQDDSKKLIDLTHKIWSFFPNIWDISLAPLDKVLFISFLVTSFEQIGLIHRSIRRIPLLQPIEMTLCLEIEYFDNDRVYVLEELCRSRKLDLNFES